MSTLLTLAMWVLFGLACAYYAKERGRKPMHWFFIGLFLGIIGLILLFILPSLKNIQKKILTAAAVPPPSIPDKLQKLWYYLDGNNEQFGPMSFTALKRAKDEEKISSQSYVWNEEMDNWKKYEEAIELLL